MAYKITNFVKSQQIKQVILYRKTVLNTDFKDF